MIRRLLLVAAFVGTVAPAAAARADSVPFSDPAATGTITLCDVNGHVATHGDTRIKPFVWRAVGSTAAPAAYNGKGRTAALYGYQPIEGVDPGQWNGDYLTFSASYTSTTRPMAGATAADRTLADLLADYPPKWDGLVELRMFIGAPGLAPLTARYDAATLRVSGTRWTLLDGGHSGCGSGRATSGELVLPSVAALPTPAADATTDAPASDGRSAGRPPAAHASPAGSGGAATPTPVSGSTQRRARPVASGGGGATPSTAWALLVAAVALAGGGVVWWRVRRPRRRP